jgi:hypothetical protein
MLPTWRRQGIDQYGGLRTPQLIRDASKVFGRQAIVICVDPSLSSWNLTRVSMGADPGCGTGRRSGRGGDGRSRKLGVARWLGDAKGLEDGRLAGRQLGPLEDVTGGAGEAHQVALLELETEIAPRLAGGVLGEADVTLPMRPIPSASSADHPRRPRSRQRSGSTRPRRRRCCLSNPHAGVSHGA